MVHAAAPGRSATCGGPRLCEDPHTHAMRHGLTLTGILLAAASVGGQAPSAGLDRATISRIRTEAMDKSQAVDHVWWLSEVYGDDSRH